MKLLRFEHVNQVCQNLEATRQFYQTLFPDWKVRAEGDDWIHFGDDQFYLSLSQSGSGIRRSTGHIDHIGFVIDDSDKMKAILDANDIEYFTMHDSPETKCRIYISDPDGTPIELVEYTEAYAMK